MQSCTSVVEKPRELFLEKNIEDCKAFIKAAEDKTKEIHLAIVSADDEYMGTVSLKSIDRDNDIAF